MIVMDWQYSFIFCRESEWFAAKMKSWHEMMLITTKLSVLLRSHKATFFLQPLNDYICSEFSVLCHWQSTSINNCSVWICNEWLVYERRWTQLVGISLAFWTRKMMAECPRDVLCEGEMLKSCTTWCHVLQNLHEEVLQEISGLGKSLTPFLV